MDSLKQGRELFDFLRLIGIAIISLTEVLAEVIEFTRVGVWLVAIRLSEPVRQEKVPGTEKLFLSKRFLTPFLRRSLHDLVPLCLSVRLVYFVFVRASVPDKLEMAKRLGGG